MEQSVVLDVNEVLETYRYFVPTTKLKLLNLRQWLPLEMDSELAEKSAYLVAKVMGDGNLDRVFTCRFIGQLSDLEKLRELIINHYFIAESCMTIRFKKARGESYMLQVNDSLFGRFLYSLGAPIGNKTRNEFSIPNWIKSSRKCSRSFLQALFDDELATIKIRRAHFFTSVIFKLCKTDFCQTNLVEFLSQIKQLTESFGVQCSNLSGPHDENEQKDGTKTYSRYFRILGNRVNIVVFSENIGFNLNSKKVNSLKQGLELIRNAGRGI